MCRRRPIQRLTEPRLCKPIATSRCSPSALSFFQCIHIAYHLHIFIEWISAAVHSIKFIHLRPSSFDIPSLVVPPRPTNVSTIRRPRPGGWMARLNVGWFEWRILAFMDGGSLRGLHNGKIVKKSKANVHFNGINNLMVECWKTTTACQRFNRSGCRARQYVI